MKTPPEDALSLLRAYLAAEYRAAASGTPVTLRIGQAARVPGVADGAPLAFLTAWNPRSLARSESENRAALAELRAGLEREGARVLDGDGVAADGSWQEPSLLAIGLTPERADEWARTYEQNAIVTAVAGEPARLRVHRTEWRDGATSARLDTTFVDWVASGAAG